MSLDIQAILDKIVSHALSLGTFETVNQHEPKNAPGNGVTAAVWVQNIAPVGERSGLAATSGRLAFMVRVFQNAFLDPPDLIDPVVVSAVDELMSKYSGDFELGGNVAYIDLLGAHGQALSAQAGYVTIDNKTFRIMDITLPVIINDIWSQTP